MILSVSRLTAVALSALFLGDIGKTQPVGPNPFQKNDMPLNNGTDMLMLYSDPSVGSDCGAGFVDFSGDFFWKAYPSEALQSAKDKGGIDSAPDKELVGFSFELFDTDWSNSACLSSIMITTGIVGTSPPLEGVITPDFSDPNAFLMLGGPLGFPDPCFLDPTLCIGGCPVNGFANGYMIDMSFGTCTGDGLLLVADGLTHHCVTSFVPGGMTFLSGDPGPCGLGDYTIMGAHSVDETQFPDPSVGDPSAGGGQNPYGGFQLGGSGLMPEPATNISTFTLQFCEPTLSVYVGTDPTTPAPLPPAGLKFRPGVAGLQPDTTFGPTSLRYVLYDEDGLPAGTEFALAAISAFLPLLPAPGGSILGGCTLINPGDPIVLNTLRNGIVALEDNGGFGLNNGIFQSNVVLLPQAPGFTLKAQGFVIDLTAPLALRETNVFTMRTH